MGTLGSSIPLLLSITAGSGSSRGLLGSILLRLPKQVLEFLFSHHSDSKLGRTEVFLTQSLLLLSEKDQKIRALGHRSSPHTPETLDPFPDFLPW